MQKDINISIAAGEALSFLESSSGTVSMERFEQSTGQTRLNVYLILELLLSEKLVAIRRNANGVSVIGPGRNLGMSLVNC
ncbi:MAG: hypothetical protein KGJ09_04300 [Candidatus Omnitrophica bacterium]|nr:hypothetical protein [Candidatus Omnitrophota bacterium]MDE2009283.1 hypothetical protein [Candidatus Omnitrophota bacterium]MDE2213802.1 hypothetical protein [Candidatus Omnitrophota bacterium]MDE2230621.1 hypothetical protein [Candidatus Omnitrophota bacterium]